MPPACLLNAAASSVADFHAPEAAVEMMAFGLIILAAHLGGKLGHRLRLSEVTGQLLGGAMVGPYVLHLIGVLPDVQGGAYDDAIHAFHFFVFVFLSMVAFGIGEELYISRLKKVGIAAVIICMIQGAFTWLLISGAFYLTNSAGLIESLLIGSIGIATAPAVSFVLMNKLNIEGRLRNLLGSIVVLDDMIEVIIFSFMLQILQLKAQGSASLTGMQVAGPVFTQVLTALFVGMVIFIFLRITVNRRAFRLNTEKANKSTVMENAFLQSILTEHPSPSVEVFLLVMGSVALGAGLAFHLHWPFLITAVFAGFLVANFHSHAIFDSLKIDNIAPVLNLGFFALIGANISLAELDLATLWLVVLYIAMRMTGKILGTWIGCRIMKEDRKITVCLPRLMLPQAGVAAVESVYASAVLGRPEFTAIILPAIVFFEVVGVYMVDRGLRNWQSWVTDEEIAMAPEPAGSSLAEAARCILEYMPEKHIKIPLLGTDKQTVLEELIDHTRFASNMHVDRVQAIQMITERERLSPTALGKGAAFPHCRLMGAERTSLVFGRHPRGIAYGGPSHGPCDLFFLMLSSARHPAEHLKLLAAVGRLMQEDFVREGFRLAVNAKEMHAFLEDLRDEKRVAPEDKSAPDAVPWDKDLEEEGP